MIKNLTKSQYYKQKKIPIVTMCRKLEPQVPARTHLLELLPKLGAQFQKIQTKTSCQNKMNLELANALKIIHQLEYQLEVMTSTCHTYEEELFISRNNVKDLERKNGKLEEKCLGLEAQMQKADFNMKVKIQQEKEQWASVIGQYERKLQEVNDSYNRLIVDRQKQLKNVEKFHETTMNKANSQLQEIQISAQSDIKRFQRQLEKATQENISMRQKLTDLETCNQEHLRQLRKANNDLAQTNLRLKTDYEHKIITLQAQLDLYQNKNKEMFDTIALWQKKLAKQSQNWSQQKIALSQQQMESEAALRRSYDQILKQKDKIMQQLNKKSYDLTERETKIFELNEKIKRIQKVCSDFQQQRLSLVTGFDKTRKELIDKMQVQFDVRLNETISEVQRKMHQKANELLDQQRNLQEQKLRKQVQKLNDKIRNLENQLGQSSHSLLVSQQLVRKLEFNLSQLNVNLEYQITFNRDQQISFKNQTDGLQNDLENRCQNLKIVHSNEMQKIKTDYQIAVNSLKSEYEPKLRQFQRVLFSRDGIIKDLEGKLRRFDQDFGNQRMSFIGRVQAFEVALGKLKNSNEQLTKINSELEGRLKTSESELRHLETLLQQQVQQRNRVVNQMKIESDTLRKTKEEFRNREVDFMQKQKQNQTQLLEMRKKQTISSTQIQRLKSTINNLQQKCRDLLSQLSQQEQNRINLQKKLSEMDTSSQQKWKLIENDFIQINKKVTQQSKRNETKLQNIIGQKQQELKRLRLKMDEVDGVLLRQRNDKQMMNISWQKKYIELEEENKKMIKSSFTMQDLEKDNISKDTVIANLKKDLEKMRVQVQNKQKIIQQLQLQIQQVSSNVQSLKGENYQKTNQIKNYTFKISQIQNQFTVFRDKVVKEGQQLRRKDVQTNEQLRKKQEQLRNMHKNLEQQSLKYTKLVEEKKKVQLKMQQLQKEYEEDSKNKKIDKIESIKRTSELEAALQQIQSSLKQKISKLEFDVSVKHQQIVDRQTQMKRLLKKIDVLQADLYSLNQELKLVKSKYESERLCSSQYKAQLERLKVERMEFERKVRTMIEQIQRLQKQSQKTEKDIIKIYEQSDKRVQIAIEQTKSYYNRELAQKNIEIEQIKKRIKASIEEQREQSKRREGKINEEKQQIYKEVIEKTCKITEITIAYEELGQVYQQVLKELQIYKKKWNKMFSQFNDNNQELSQINFKLQDFRTDDKKTKKTIKQTIETKTDRTQRILTTDNQTPISQNATPRPQQPHQHSSKNISAFNQSQNMSINIRNGQQNSNRILTTLMSNSGVINSNSNQGSSDLSVRLDSSSISSKISNKD